MAQDVTVPGSPLFILTRLLTKLNQRQPDLKVLSDYYDGKHRLAFSSQKFRNAFGGMFSAFADNFCPLIVEAVEERLNIEGFRYGSDPTADKDAWRIWQTAQMDALSQIGHNSSLKLGDSYAIVWGDDDGQPRISVESARQVIVAYAPGDRTKRVAALKSWIDEDGKHATLFLPDFVYTYKSSESTMAAWVPDAEAGDVWPMPNPLGVVPVVPLTNRPDLDVEFGVSEFLVAIPLQDAINKLSADLLVASEYIAFPQRYVTGLEIPVDDNGNPVQPFEISLDKLLIAEDPGAKFGTLTAGDLQNYVTALTRFTGDVATLTRTPPHYFGIGGQFPSGDALKAAETALVAKSRRKMRFYGEAWEEVMALAFKVLGDPRGDVVDAETIWGDPEYRSEAELADALVKRAAIGVPRQQLWEDAGYTQTQISRFHAMEVADSLDKLLAAPAIPTVPAVKVTAEA